MHCREILFTPRCSPRSREFPKSVWKIFTLGVIFPKIWNRKSVKQAPHSEHAIGHRMHCREILFTPRCRPRTREFPRSVNFSVRRTVVELWGVKVAQFSDFGLFSPYKTPKTYLPVTAFRIMSSRALATNTASSFMIFCVTAEHLHWHITAKFYFITDNNVKFNWCCSMKKILYIFFRNLLSESA